MLVDAMDRVESASHAWPAMGHGRMVHLEMNMRYLIDIFINILYMLHICISFAIAWHVLSVNLVNIFYLLLYSSTWSDSSLNLIY